MIICFVLPKWCGCAKISCFLENHVPAEFNQDTLEFAHEHHNCLQKKRRARQCIGSVGPIETSQERRNRLHRK
jgi:hypothetical protein